MTRRSGGSTMNGVLVATDKDGNTAMVYTYMVNLQLSARHWAPEVMETL